MTSRDTATETRSGFRPSFSTEKKPVLPSPKKQRPQQAFKRRVEPPKPATKVGPKQTKVAKAPVKTSGVQDSSSGSTRKQPVPKKQEEVKKPAPPPEPVEPPLQGGHYELNARMTKMVETELQDIMIKVWQELPDNPSDEAETLVVDKLRNQAGDFLRNVLGLNITKRLLNVHNPLYVKVKFSGKPEKVHLGEFLKKYNFTAFKRIEKTVNMFAAQVKTINDFDRICSEADVRCGDIKVTVTPIYKFTKCPPNLVTSFYDQDEDASDDTPEITKKEENPENVTSPEKVLATTENVSTKPKEETKDKVVSKPVENKTVVNKPATDNKAATAVSKPAVENKAAVKPVAENKTTPAAVKPVAENKTTPAAVKPVAENKTTPAAVKAVVENKTIPNKTAVENKTAVNKPAVNNQVNKTPVKPAAKKPAVNIPIPEKAVSKPAVQNKTVTKPAADVKPSPTKTEVNKTAVVNKAAAVNKTAVANKPAAENKVVKKAQVAPKTNETGKKPAPSPAKASDKTNKVDDYDELDDHDILALMSEGIVLDECSGSDEE